MLPCSPTLTPKVVVSGDTAYLQIYIKCPGPLQVRKAESNALSTYRC